MINEALDYHMNMNHVVFNRERKHVEVAGQQVLDPNKTDIIIEGTVRERINKIMTAIQRLAQSSLATQTVIEEQKDPVEGEEVAFGLDKKTIEGNTTLRSAKYISDSIATILSEYNSLCDYIDLQHRQTPFSQSSISGLDGLVKQLINPLKSVLVPSMFSDKQEYTRIYNVIRAIISSIQIGFPLQKVNSSMLSERVPLNRDIIEAKEFDPNQQKNRDYLAKIFRSLNDEKLKLEERVTRGTPLQREAIQMRLQVIQQQLNSINDTGFVEYEQEDTEDERRGERLLAPIRDYETILREIKDILEANPSKEKLKVIIGDLNTLLKTIDGLKIEKELKTLSPSVRNDVTEHVNRLREMIKTRIGRSEFLFTSNPSLKPLQPIDVGVGEEKEGEREDVDEKRKQLETLELLRSNLLEYTDNPEIIEKINSRTYRELYNEYSKYKQEIINDYIKTTPTRKVLVDSFNPGITKEEKAEIVKDEIITRFIPDNPSQIQQIKNMEYNELLNEYSALRKLTIENFKALFPSRKALIGEGKKKQPKKTGGHVHMNDVFDDEEELKPYLTKHLRPSKYRKNVPAIESSSEESSGEEGDGSDMEINELRIGKGKKKGTRKQRKLKEDIKIITSLPTKEASVLIEKKNGGSKRLLKPNLKPVIADRKADKDLWFM
jgi:hypothetical protein